MKMRLILLKNVKYNYTVAREVDEEDNYGQAFSDDEYVALSEVVEVDFPELSSEEVINGQVAVIEKQITKVMADSEAAITALNGRKQELLALTCNA